MTYSEKEIDKAAEAVIEKIARKLSNDILFGMDRKETNADRIRTMTDEEMADWLIMNGDGSDYETWLAWLKQEAGT